MMASFRSNFAKFSPSKDKSEEKKPAIPERDLKFFRTRLSGIDDIMRPFENKAALLKSCNRVKDFGARQRAQERLLRKDCMAELKTVKASLKALEEEQKIKTIEKPPVNLEDFLHRMLIQQRVAGFQDNEIGSDDEGNGEEMNFDGNDEHWEDDGEEDPNQDHMDEEN